MKNKKLNPLLRYTAIFGNIVFLLWISLNAMDERFNGTLPEKVSYVALSGLLIVNCFLLINRKKEMVPQP